MNPSGGFFSRLGPSRSAGARRFYASLAMTGLLGFGLIAAEPALAEPSAPATPAPAATAASSTAKPTPSASPSPTVSLAPAESGSSPSAAPPNADKIAPSVLPKMQQVKLERGTGGATMGQGLKRLKENRSTQDNKDNTTSTRTDATTQSVSTQSLSTQSLSGNVAAPMATWQAPGVQGLDVSGWQSNVDWQAQWNMGARFAYVKATEGIDFTSSGFNSQYPGSAAVGMIRGAYHFALPSQSSAVDQANYFVDNGGGWSADGTTLPPLLDIEYNPYSQLGDTCYNMAGTAMVNWIRAFSNQILARTGRTPAIYTTTDWWTKCTGNSAAFGDSPLHIAAYSTWVGPMPASWDTYSIWQYSSTGPFAGDSNAWNGDYTSLQTFAYGAPAAVVKAIQAEYANNPGLGSPTTGVICGLTAGGCYQNYQGGAILWSPATGANTTGGQIRVAYSSQGFETGPLGYPTGDTVCGLKDGGCYQNYQGGAILWTSATGAQISLNGAIRTAWQQSGFETGPLGYPTGPKSCGLRFGGCYQNFQNGAILWSANTGAQLSVNGPIRTAYSASGFENGNLGFPTASQVCGQANGGCYQNFQGGTISWSTATGAWLVGGPIQAAWVASGREAGSLGYPTGAQACGLTNGGCYQNFQGGAILWSTATGAQISPNGPIRDAWSKSGFESGPLGYPTGPQVCGIKDGGCYQNFQNGAILWSTATGAQISLNGPVRSAYSASGFESGVLGYPTAAQVCGLKDGGCSQSFQGGQISWSSATGAQVLTGTILTAYASAGKENGALGYPNGAQVCGIKNGGCYQNFQNGAILWSSATGAQISPNGPIRDAWSASGFEAGALGYPTGPQVCGIRDGGCYQNFQGGAILWSSSTGAQISPTGPIRDAWSASGFEAGALGYPTGPQVCGIRDGGCYQNFQNGAILWSSATGAHPNRGAIRSRYGSLGFENSFLGYPVSDETAIGTDGSVYQNFQGGSITWSPTAGTSVSTSRR